MKVAILGATGKTGRYVVPALLDAACDVLALGRDQARLAALDPRCRTAIVDLDAPDGLAAALADAAIVVSLAHARFAETILGALPAACDSPEGSVIYLDLADAEGPFRYWARSVSSDGIPGPFAGPVVVEG